MAQTVRLEGTTEEPVVTGDDLATGEFAVVVDTRGPSTIRPGTVTVRGMGQLVFPGENSYSCRPDTYRVRRLRPGERIVITQE